MSKLIAILGDIHSNLEALEAVLADCRKAGVTDFLCTGDVVGYNASPRECLKLVRELGCPVVKGNHDQYVADGGDLADFHPHAAAVVKWTRDQLEAADMEWLMKLPYSEVRAGIGIVHGTMDSPERFGYVFDTLQAEANFAKQMPPLCFHGHTHCPMIFEKQMSGAYRIDPQSFRIPAGRKYFVNVGSVGQPRDGDPRSSYVIYDVAKRALEFRRVEYDIESAKARILRAGLPSRLAFRLGVGQ